MNDYRWKHGSVCVKGSNVTTGKSIRTNDPKTMSDVHMDRCSIHAEVRAVVRHTGSRQTVYVARVNKRGELRNSRPCNNCISTLQQLGIKEVIHT